MRYFRLNIKDMFFSSKKTYAYLSVNKSNEIINDEGDKFIKFKCPYCGYEKINYFYPSKHIAVFNKDKVGDFSIGCTGFGYFAISERFLNILMSNEIKGIKEIKKYNRLETVKKGKINSIEGNYYDVLVETIPILLKQKNDVKIIKENHDNVRCDICCVNGYGNDYIETDVLYFEGLQNVEYDIFCSIENTNILIVSEKFVKLCIENNITNILHRFIEVYESE